MSDIRKQIRSKTVGAKSEFKSKKEEVNGVEIEVRQPSVAARGKIMQRSRDNEKTQQIARGKSSKDKNAKDVDTQDILSSLDYGKMQVWAVIMCSYVPDTDERVFDESDFDSLYNRPSGGFIDRLSTIAMNLMNVEPEEDAKN